MSSNRLSLVVAGAAVLIATTGTAVAVTATTVNIADPSAPTRIAHVDGTGRLTTAGPTSTLAFSTDITTAPGGAYTFITSPTTASLAITELAVGNDNQPPGDANDDYGIILYKMAVSGAGACTTTPVGAPLQRWSVLPGTHYVHDFTAPLLFKATGSAKYCLAVVGYTIGNGADSGPHFAYVSYTGFVASGTYTGAGTMSAQNAAVAIPAGSRTKR